KLLSDRDRIEVGAFTRMDTIEQTDTRLYPDGTILRRNVDATIDATSIAGYVDAAIYPLPRVVVRGGTRVDSVAYSVANHLGNKAVVDYAAGRGVHLIASYGEGFRTPQARDLAEGQTIPFATIQSLEFG